MARDLLCLSHLRWDFVYQRPNHLMARAARGRRVFFIEEPVYEAGRNPALRTAIREGVTVVTPVVPDDVDAASLETVLASLLDELRQAEGIAQPILWYYTPMARPWTRHIPAAAVVYDSMDFLAGFRGAPPRLLELEDELVSEADLVFAGGASLHGRMRDRHRSTHCFPSSIDVAHFARARARLGDPADQAGIGRPRIGYAGVIDERIDLDLIDAVAAARPDLEIVLVGPTAKIDPADVPAHRNVHRLGLKPYADLPAYLGGWDVGWMPFARNEATRFISPTKTPEYLAAGLPVISTSIHDVVEPYGTNGLVAIADLPADTLRTIDRTLADGGPDRGRVDAFLASGSWDRTWAAMERLIEDVVGARERRAAAAARRTTRPGRGRRATVRRPLIETPLAPRRSAGALASGASSAAVASLRPPAAE